MPGLEGLEAYLTTSRSVVMPISSLSAMYFVYGLYTALFISYIRILRCRCERTGERSQAKTLYLLPTIMLFILTTLVVIGQTIYRGLGSYITYDAVQTNDFKPLIHYLQQDPRKTAALALTFTCATLLNVAADYILIHRCHMIWGCRKWITLPLVVASISTNVVGMVGVSVYATGDRDTTIDKNVYLASLGHLMCSVFLVMSIIVNILITILTAGRIWWMSRQYHGNERFYKSVLRILIESGLVYPIFTLVHLIMPEMVSYQNIPFESFCISYQTAGIAPTLIVVRAQLRKTVETMHNHDDVVSEINLTSCHPPSNWSSGDGSRTVAPVHSFKMQAHDAGSGNRSSGNDSRTQAPDDVFKMLHAHESGSGSFGLEERYY